MPLRRRRTGHRCPACDQPAGERHAPGCRVLTLTGAWRHPVNTVTMLDTATQTCGCPALLVRAHGDRGHRRDHHQPDTTRPAGFTRTEAAIYAILLLLAGVNYYVATRSYEPRDTIVAFATATVMTLAVTAIYLLRADHAPTEWAGHKTYIAGQPGRFVRCTHCAGDGIVFAEAYPDTTPHR